MEIQNTDIWKEKKEKRKNKKERFGSKDRLTKLANNISKIIIGEEGRLKKDLLNIIFLKIK